MSQKRTEAVSGSLIGDLSSYLEGDPLFKMQEMSYG